MKTYSDTTSALKHKKTMLVGHNLFLDLIYFYKCFFGPLPMEVRDFIPIMRAIFPTIFDTKFLADALNKDSSNYKSSLEDIIQNLESSDAPVPIIEVPAGLSKYVSDKPAHEAGYDNYLTAVALIKMSAHTDGSMSLANYGSSFDSSSSSSDSSFDGGVRLDTKIQSTTQYGRGMFDNLAQMSPEDASDNPSSEEKSTIRTMVPAVNSPFWPEYGNKIGVDGTQGEVCYNN